MMIFNIAWRNVWRNPLRSLVIMAAIMAGVWSLSFAFGFYNGFIVSFINNGLQSEYSHLQIHHPEYKKDREIQFSIIGGSDFMTALQQRADLAAITQRTIATAMISSASTASGVLAYGVDPKLEASVTRLDSAIVEGAYFEGIRRNPILISTKIAEKLKVKIRSKIVLTFQDINGEIVAASFRVAGIFNTEAPRVNNGNVYVRQSDLNPILGLEEQFHEIAFLLHDIEQDEVVKAGLISEHPEALVESWRDLAPELLLTQNQVKVNMGIILGIIMFALGSGIVNTMLMAVLERFREIGMLMAVGMKKLRVFLMIILETLLMAAVGGPIGFLLGFATVEHFNYYGLDLSQYSEGLNAYGFSAVLYPAMDLDIYIMIAVGVIITALAASIYPAYKAIKLNPVEALRKL